MMSFDLTHGEIALIAVTFVLVVVPSRIGSMGNLIGRVLKGGKG